MDTYYQINRDYIVRVEFWGGLIINPTLNKEYVLDFTNVAFLKLIDLGLGVNEAIELLIKKGYKDKIYLDTFINLNILINKNEELCKDVDVNDIFEKIDSIKETKYLSAPLQVSLYLTYKCQLNCKFCYFKEKRNLFSNNKGLSLESWFKIIDEIKDMGVPYLSLLGGEPTLYKDIYKLLEYIESKEIKTTITSNGINWDDKLIDFVANSKYITPSFSLQSLNEDINKNLMGCSSNHVMELVDKFINKGKTPRINTVITNQPIEKIFDLVDYCYKKRIYDFFTNVYLDKFDDGFKSKGFIEYRKIKEDILMYIKEKGYKEMNFQLQGCLFYSAYPEIDFNLDSEYEYIKYGCEAGNTKIEIMPNGDIYPCSAFGVDDYKYLNVLENSINYIWNNAQYFDKLRTYRIEDKKCLSCKFLKFCNGGCPAYNIKENNSLTIKGDKRCSIIQSNQ